MKSKPLILEQKKPERPKWKKVLWAVFVVCFAIAITTKGLGLW